MLLYARHVAQQNIHALAPGVDDLAAFLRARRSELRPEDVGLQPAGQLRRVPGLRREEVAQLANISADYYTRMERGKVAPPSPLVLDALAAALRLDEDHTRYLHTLAVSNGRDPRSVDPAEVHPGLLNLLAHQRHLPGLIVGPMTEVLAWNDAAARLFVDFGALPAQQRQAVRLLFTNDEFASRFCDRQSAAVTAAQLLRQLTARHGTAPRVRQLVDELSACSTDFVEAWNTRRTVAHSHGSRLFNHPELGTLALRWQGLMAPGVEDEMLLLLLPLRVGDETDERLLSLA